MHCIVSLPRCIRRAFGGGRRAKPPPASVAAQIPEFRHAMTQPCRAQLNLNLDPSSIHPASPAMVLVLVIGDLHIPTLTHDLPAKFKKLLVPGKIGQILCTGNVCDKETYDYLRTIAPEVHIVRGEFDEVVPAGDGEMLAALARQMDVDVLVTGGTHRFEAFEFDGRFFGPVIVTYVYQLVDGEVDKVEYRKPDRSQDAQQSSGW
ncbi:retrograde transporter [Trichosporon asahii var. asahii CBS 2479]|uniref:Retrograde transporter n=1 Tax=Trichosporon asahii var. asahii (strain ATCC 90039 / CBS 2479 / JCM 2466 / KCTC 7840 / NBRC 103889/ NCYC 2677 / UAMH 7654) TaxID=1186058 RepID=J4U5D6_TRIAS|nr:retrograde transporter [Trichosporon asahii var. asahii CBS 2479]EJT45175.1 retrograde transporter [Trichosporon asahii var. asahii CBS 2479]